MLVALLMLVILMLVILMLVNFAFVIAMIFMSSFDEFVDLVADFFRELRDVADSSMEFLDCPMGLLYFVVRVFPHFVDHTLDMFADFVQFSFHPFGHFVDAGAVVGGSLLSSLMLEMFGDFMETRRAQVIDRLV